MTFDGKLGMTSDIFSFYRQFKTLAGVEHYIMLNLNRYIRYALTNALNGGLKKRSENHPNSRKGLQTIDPLPSLSLSVIISIQFIVKNGKYFLTISTSSPYL